MDTKIMRCACKHDYQDARYGKGMRVHNKKTKPADTKEHRCTVCGTVREG